MRLVHLSGLVLAAACQAASVPLPVADFADTEPLLIDSGVDVLELDGCTFDSAVATPLVQRATGVVTVFETSFESTIPVEGRVFVADADGGVRSVPTKSTDGLTHTAVLLGLLSNADYEVWWEATDPDGQRFCDKPRALETATFPAQIPAVAARIATEARTEGYHLLPIVSETTSSLVIVDSDGEVVWGTLIGTKESSDVDGDFEPPDPAFRMRLDPFGRGVLFNTQGRVSTDDGDVELLTWAGDRELMATFPGGHTDFVVLPDGGYAMLGWVVLEQDGRRILGDTLLVRDPDGSLAVLWSTFDSFAPDPHRSYSTGYTEDEPPVEDWSHANGLSYDANEDVFLVTVTEPSAVVKIDRSSGDVLWTVADGSPDFNHVDPAFVELPHSAQVVDGGFVVFNRSRLDEPHSCSHFADLELDQEHRTVVRSRYWQGETCRQNGFLGSAERLDNGHTIMTWSSYGMVEEVDREDRTVLQLVLPLGAGFGFGTFAADLPGMLR